MLAQIRDQYMHSNGTTAYETFSIILPSFFLTFIACVLSFLFVRTAGQKFLLRRLCLEFVLIVVPIILIITVLAQYVNEILIALFFVSLSLCIVLLKRKGQLQNRSKQKYENSRSNFITLSRSTINLISVIGILAVDFSIFPRTSAKTKKYGFSLMDVGVGLYVFSNGVVAPEIRGNRDSFTKTIKGVIPLVIIGAARFLATKEIQYHVPVSEYGVHWNFFITLAVTRIFTSVILKFTSVDNAIFSGISLLLAHEIILQLGLASFVLSNVKRTNFFTANREGIVSSLGYVGLYFLSVTFGKFINTKGGKIPKPEWKVFIKLSLISVFLLWATLILDKKFGVSRRLANSGYCMWIMFIGVFMTTLFYLAELIQDSVGERGTNVCIKVPFMFEAINYNGLAFFLVANLLTGLINIVFDTLKITTIWSLIVLTIYMLLNCSISCFLFIRQVKLKL